MEAACRGLPDGRRFEEHVAGRGPVGRGLGGRLCVCHACFPLCAGLKFWGGLNAKFLLRFVLKKNREFIGKKIENGFFEKKK
jgi:hypothetical protein